MDNKSPQYVELFPHPAARSQARARRDISAGSTILSVAAFASALLDTEKSRRCDACFRQSPQSGQLKRCTGCIAYYYCDADCQRMHWDKEHKRICRIYNKMVTLAGSRGLTQHERMDVLLLSHFLARIAPVGSKDASRIEDEDDSLRVFLSLLPGPGTPPNILDILPKSLNSQAELTQDIYSRFHNNNFTIHSHMNTVGHGVFPLASRYFNHSCVPNAAPRYVLTPNQPVNMEVVALRDINIGEEICVPYLDPALMQSKHQAFRYTYGFVCGCKSCVLLRGLDQGPEQPQSLAAVTSIGGALREFVGIDKMLGPDLPISSIEGLPLPLRGVLHEEYLEHLSDEFSKAAHEGDYATAITSGHTLLALYLLIYPTNYPQIGLHLLELAKTKWNALMSSNATTAGVEAGDQVRMTLSHARKVLLVYGREGDENGPLDEIHKLERLLDE